MQDVEIESLLIDAGYTYDPVANEYASGSADDEVHTSDFVADELEIPREDLARWEEEQRQADEATET